MTGTSDFVKRSTICKETYKPTWVIHNADAFVDGLVKSVDMPNFICCPGGNWSLDIAMFSNGNDSYSYVRAVFNKLQPSEEIHLPVTAKAAFALTNGSLSFSSFPLSEGQQRFEKQLIATSTLKGQRANYIKDNKLEIVFEIVQCSVKYGYNEDAIDACHTPQSTGKALQDFSPYLNQAKLADLKIVVDKKTFAAHKVILAASSPVFAAMFDSDMKEANENKVKVQGFSEQVVEEFLHFLYTGSAPNLIKMSKDLLGIAHFYQVETLLHACEEVLCEQLTVNNAAEILLLSHVHGAKKLKTAAKNFIVANLKKVVTTATWKDLMKEDNQLANEILEMLGNTVASPE